MVDQISKQAISVCNRTRKRKSTDNKFGAKKSCSSQIAVVWSTSCWTARLVQRFVLTMRGPLGLEGSLTSSTSTRPVGGPLRLLLVLLLAAEGRGLVPLGPAGLSALFTERGAFDSTERYL